MKSANHAELRSRSRAGATARSPMPSGFGEGAFTLQLTGVDGQTVTDTFSWPSSGIAGQLLVGEGNFH